LKNVYKNIYRYLFNVFLISPKHRELLEKLEEAETSNNHLLKRLDKLKNAKSAILKDL